MKIRAIALAALAASAGCKPQPQTLPDAGSRVADAAAAVPAAPAAPVRSAPAAASAASSASPADDGCVHADSDERKAGIARLEGKIGSGTHGHPNGSSFTFYTLTLSKAVCVRGAEDVTDITEVQLTSTAEPAVDFKRWLGKNVRITGAAFPQETAWHVRPVLVDVRTIEKR